MIVLGVTGLFHDASAALVRDGELVVYAEEERLIRQKHAHGKFPHQAIRFCLRKAGVDFRDIDALAFYYDCDRSLGDDWKVEPFFSHFQRHPHDLLSYFRNLQTIRSYVESFARDRRRPAGSDRPPRLPSGDRLPVLAVRAGQYPCRWTRVENRSRQSWQRARGTQITHLAEIPMPHSLGMLYSAVTHFLGFTFSGDGEGSVMGLASYGEGTASPRCSIRS